jgi:hypothetical protein
VADQGRSLLCLSFVVIHATSKHYAQRHHSRRGHQPGKQEQQLDPMLSVVLLIFSAELVVLSLLEANSVWSSSHAMGFIGAVSLAFNFSLLLDCVAAVPIMAGDIDARGIILIRAVRAAWVGARAGRLSRVLRIFCFLPGNNEDDSNHKNKGIAVVISRQL